MKNKTISEALRYVSTHPEPSNENLLVVPIHELVARKLFDIANYPDPKVRGSQARSVAAQKIIFDRMVGRRRPGTHPVQNNEDEIEFDDLTLGALTL